MHLAISSPPSLEAPWWTRTAWSTAQLSPQRACQMPSPSPIVVGRGQSRCTLMELRWVHPTVCPLPACEAPLLNPTRPGRTEDGLAKDLSLADSRPVWSEPMHVDGARICASSDVSRASRRGCTAGWHRNALSQSQPFLRCQSQFTLLSAHNTAARQLTGTAPRCT